MSDSDALELDEKPFSGGIVNAGSVVRIGDRVYRPAGAHTPVIHALFRHLRARNFLWAPEAIEIRDGKECLTYIEGTSPTYPYPQWCLSDDTLAQVALRLRQYHVAAADFAIPANAQFCHSLSDPEGGSIICHNDIWPDNLVFKDGQLVGFLDFDFAAPGRPLWDIARTVLVWIPIDNPELAHSYGWGGLDPFVRLKLFCDSYGLAPSDRAQLIDLIEQCATKTESYVKGQVDAGKPAFIQLWNTFDLANVYKRRREWLALNRGALIAHITA